MQDLAGAKVPAPFEQRGQSRFARARQIPLTEIGRAHQWVDQAVRNRATAA